MKSPEETNIKIVVTMRGGTLKTFRLCYLDRYFRVYRNTDIFIYNNDAAPHYVTSYGFDSPQLQYDIGVGIYWLRDHFPENFAEAISARMKGGLS